MVSMYQLGGVRVSIRGCPPTAVLKLKAIFRSTGVKFGTIDWLVLIDNRWTRIDGSKDTLAHFEFA